MDGWMVSVPACWSCLHCFSSCLQSCLPSLNLISSVLLSSVLDFHTLSFFNAFLLLGELVSQSSAFGLHLKTILCVLVLPVHDAYYTEWTKSCPTWVYCTFFFHHWTFRMHFESSDQSLVTFIGQHINCICFILFSLETRVSLNRNDTRCDFCSQFCANIVNVKQHVCRMDSHKTLCNKK